MIIKELLLKNFGKFSDTRIELNAGINVCYGENESGKSTLYTFMKGMLFGMERGRGRASVGDTFSLYEPWENGNYYAGSLTFVSGGKHFVLERHFDKYKKGATLVCQDDGEELSLEHGDLSMLLGGMDVAGFENTIALGQLKSQTDQSLAVMLRNYAANYYATGSSDINLEAALEKLRARKKEIDREAKEISRKKQEKRDRIEQEAAYVHRDVVALEQEKADLIEELACRREQEPLKAEDVSRPPAEAASKFRVHPLEIALMIAVVIAAFIWIAKPWNYLVSIVIALLSSIYVWNRLKFSKREVPSEPEEELEKLSSEEEIVSLDKLKWELEMTQESIKEKQTQYDNLREQLAELDEISDAYRQQEQKAAALVLAEKRLTEVSLGIHKKLEQDLNRRASEILCAITGGKYTRLLIDEELRMHVLWQEKRISLNQLSRGTMEQIYFALRMASGELLYEEELPIILDDTFAYYDDKRTKDTLRWLSEQKRQVIMFTCHKRETEMLNELGLAHHLCIVGAD